MTFDEWFSQQKFDGDPLFLLEECWKAAQANREWIGLTKKEMITIWEANVIYHDGLIEDVESKLKDKNT